MGAYTLGVGSEVGRAIGTAAVWATQGKHRRRLPSPAEQARRKAWGRKWGRLVGDAVKTSMEEQS